VSPKLPRSELDEILALARPKLLVGDITSGVAIPRAPIDADLSAFDGSTSKCRVATYWKAMSSGGSTGRPKIIVDHQAASLDPENSVTAKSVGIDKNSVVLNPGPLYHNAPFLFAHMALFVGSRLVGMPRFDAEEALRLIEHHRVTFTVLVPTMMHRIWSLPAAVRRRYDLSSLQRVWHMAAPCPAWLKQAWIDWLGAECIFELYGGTERNGSTIIRGDEWLRKRGSVGRVVGDRRIKAMREDGTDCAQGEIGELYFQSSVNAPPSFHYIGAEIKSHRGWETIGDMGFVDTEGYVFLADRRTDLIVRGGANVYPAEVEAALEASSLVSSSLVIGVPCDEMGHRVHAIVQPAAGRPLDVAKLHAFLKERIAAYKLPESYEFSTTPLRDDAGKARRTALRDERAGWLENGIEFRVAPPG
jgi:bile acid-coenzyme A ligase